MTPSDQALEAVAIHMQGPHTLYGILQTYIAIDVTPLEARVKEMEAENQRLKAQLEGRDD